MVNNTVIDWFEPWPEQVCVHSLCWCSGILQGPAPSLILKPAVRGVRLACSRALHGPCTQQPLRRLSPSVPLLAALNHPQALQSVASVFLGPEDLPDAIRPGIVEHMVGAHQSVRRFSAKFEAQLRRHNYVTVGVEVMCFWRGIFGVVMRKCHWLRRSKPGRLICDYPLTPWGH